MGFSILSPGKFPVGFLREVIVFLKVIFLEESIFSTLSSIEQTVQELEAGKVSQVLVLSTLAKLIYCLNFAIQYLSLLA